MVRSSIFYKWTYFSCFDLSYLCCAYGEALFLSRPSFFQLSFHATTYMLVLNSITMSSSSPPDRVIHHPLPLLRQSPLLRRHRGRRNSLRIRRRPCRNIPRSGYQPLDQLRPPTPTPKRHQPIQGHALQIRKAGTRDPIHEHAARDIERQGPDGEGYDSQGVG